MFLFLKRHYSRKHGSGSLERKYKKYFSDDLPVVFYCTCFLIPGPFSIPETVLSQNAGHYDLKFSMQDHQKHRSNSSHSRLRHHFSVDFSIFWGCMHVSNGLGAWEKLSVGLHRWPLLL